MLFDTKSLGGQSGEQYRHANDESVSRNQSACPLLIAMFALHLPLMLVYTEEYQKAKHLLNPKSIIKSLSMKMKIFFFLTGDYNFFKKRFQF